MLTSGVRNSLSPLTGDAKRTPSSLILRPLPSAPPRLQTWKPPLSVRIGRVQPSKRCSPPRLPHDVEARPHPQVEGVAEDDLRTHFFERSRHHSLHRAVGTHGHEDRCFNDAMVERQAATPRLAVSGQQLEIEHRAIVGDTWLVLNLPRVRWAEMPFQRGGVEARRTRRNAEEFQSGFLYGSSLSSRGHEPSRLKPPGEAKAGRPASAFLRVLRVLRDSALKSVRDPRSQPANQSERDRSSSIASP